MSKLRLGPIADDKPVKLMLELPGSVHRELLQYAAVHARSHGLSEPIPLEKIAAAMIERFVATDRGFARERRDHQ